MQRKKLLFVVGFLLVHYFIANNVFFLSKDIIYGDFSANQRLLVLPRYPFMRIPKNRLTVQYNAVDRLAADFAQIYFPSQKPASLNESYSKEKTLDPWHRPSRYAPFIHFVCSKTFCKLNYGYASFFHLSLQLFLFYVSFGLSFRILKINRYLLPCILLANSCLFLTPGGLSWFERGQFSLYVTLSYLWLIIGLMKRNIAYITLAALFGFIKWTSFPYIFTVFSVLTISSHNIEQLKDRVFMSLTFALTTVLLFSLFFDSGLQFLNGLFFQESVLPPRGISLARIMPKYLVKTIPATLIILGCLSVRNDKDIFPRIVPFLIGAAVILVTYPTLSYDYSVPCLFCFIPLVIYWIRHGGIDVKPKVKHALGCSFVLFLVLASLSGYIARDFATEKIVIYGYVMFSAIFIVTPFVSLRSAYRKAMSASIEVSKS